ncbi:MAG: DinB family protein [Chloroflexia bacterium]|nr:DinB family protein [Chloroflexia bacterium]
MPLTPAEITTLIAQYAAGPDLLRAALAEVPVAALQWRPAPDEWSVHEIVIHCGDSETASAHRIRVLIAEPEPVIVGYDQAAWATRLDYHTRSLDLALAAVTAARGSSTELIRTLPPEAWTRAGRHTESGPFTSEDWLRIYGAHLHDHADQIAANISAWLDSQR